MKTRALLALACALTLLTACGPKSELKLGLRSVAITVPRLITPALELVPPSAEPVPVALPDLPPVDSLLPPAAPAPAASACPTADPFDAPALAATPLVPKAPAPDAYTQLSLGAYVNGGKPGGLLGLVRTEVKALDKSTTSVGQLVESWSVERVDAANKSTAVEVYRLVHRSASPLATAAGIYLVGLAWDDPVRGKLRFEPAGNGLHILPNPVQLATNAAQYVGAATDPATLTTLALTRNVTGRKRVDACGQLVDTFTVKLLGTLTTTRTQRQVEWVQQLATAYGGANVEETLTLTWPVTGFAWTRTLRNTTAPKELA